MIMIVNNSIYLRRKNKVFVEKTNNVLEVNSIQIIATFLKNIESLGHILDPKLIERLFFVDLKEFATFHNILIYDLKHLLGSHVEYKPMYPNFPKQVMEASESELYINAILHYFGDWIGVRILPKYEKEDRLPLKNFKDLKVIALGDKEDFTQIFHNLLSSKTSLSQVDYDDLTWYLKSGNSIEAILPEKIIHKEILAFLAGKLIQLEKTIYLTSFFTTATDVLRLATALSDGDVSLATNTIFKHFSRKYRKLLLSLLENCKNKTEDMIKYKKKWIRLGEILHPFEYKDRFLTCYESFKIIRDNVPYETFNGQVEKYLLEDVMKASSLLKSRPGELARRLDHLLRICLYDIKKIIEMFMSISSKLSTPILLQLIAHFNSRNDEKELRIFFPKGSLAKSYSIKNELPIIDYKTIEIIVEICRKTLIMRFKKLSSLGNVFIDPKLEDYTVPLSQRSASKSLVTLSRFSKVEFPLGNTIRFFLWWKDISKKDIRPTLVHDVFHGISDQDRVDIDLSAVMYDTNWDYLEHVSYTHLRSLTYKVVHSGDITSAPKGACEFLDIDIDSVLKYSGRYIVISLLSFTGQPFTDIPECFAGWMMRKNPQSGEIFEPKTVENKVDLTSDTEICIPVIIDLQERKVIWTDLALTKNPYWQNNIEGNQKGMVLMGKGITTLNKPNLHELFSLHGQARGTITNDKDQAETVFSLSEGITPFDIDVINSEFL